MYILYKNKSQKIIRDENITNDTFSIVTKELVSNENINYAKNDLILSTPPLDN